MNGLLLNAMKSPAEIFQEDGILFYPRLFAGVQLESLREACDAVRAQFLAEIDRDRPEQKNIDRLRHLNDPKWNIDQTPWKTIMETIADPRCLGPVEQIFEGESLFRCTQLFFNPRYQSSDGEWHRDIQFIVGDEEQVKARIGNDNAMQAVQLQIALVDNDDIEYVPFSANRYDSPEEFYFRCADNRSHAREAGMPNAMRIAQRAGDAVIFNPNGLHRGRYYVENPRNTLMLTYTPRTQIMNDFFSHQPWMAQAGYLNGLSRRAQAYFTEFVETYSPFWSQPQ
jgi:hypothetical protein